MLGQRSQSQKRKYYIFYKYYMSKMGKFIKTERAVVVRFEGGRTGWAGKMGRS